ncbi:enoyl-CoA hydratase [Tamaricihabitans halophyticus]|uniref:Enoyl-CoA hydratase n=1 Tax=Tamaricihabitans halophyticus TaxID=1262583 RepID=A0A4R2QTW8_9PSEU|nr:enoyl-CoA hydratase [Tamaricihabitans halophyticus]TCP53157.1 enoyl-CoA hydratase [Tamaricihabitans halophyticus]
MDSVHIERSGAVAVLTVHAPDTRNALTLELSAQLADAVTTCETDPSVHAMVVTGTPPAFCAGANLAALGTATEDGLRRIYAGFLAVADSSLPTIAAVGGPAVGAGLNLALACDVRLAGTDARFDARFMKLGIHPGGGMTWMLQRAVDAQTAAAITLFSQVMDADEAYRAGLAHRVVSGTHGELLDGAIELAAGAAAAPRELLRTTKRTMQHTRTLPDHDAAVRLELAKQVETLNSPEFTERLARLRASTSSAGQQDSPATRPD